MNKHNTFVIFFKKFNLSVNSLLEKYLNKLNLINLSNIISSNKVFLIFVSLIILFLSYLSIPYVYNSEEIRKELENQLSNKLSLNFNLSDNVNYKFFPRPHFIINKSSILKNQKKISNIKKLRIYVALENLFSLKNIIVKDIVLEDTNFNLNKKNTNFFIKLLDNNFLGSSFIIKNSNIFFRNIDQEVLFINKIINMKYYNDPKELINFIKSENEIFNIPYTFEAHKDIEKKKFFSKIKLNFLKLQIENEFDYGKSEKIGLLRLIYDKNKSEASYKFNKNFFNFNFSDKLIDPKFAYEGNINFNPFYSIFRGNTDKLNISNLFNSNSASSQLLKTEILNNKNLNIDLSINAKKIFQLQNIIDVILNLKIHEGLIDIDRTRFSWNDHVDFKILDSLLYVNENQLVLDGKLILDIKDYNEIYKFLQSPMNLRPELKKIEFNFLYNFDQQIINFNTITIDNKIDKKVNEFLKKLILKKNNLQNKIYIKKIMKSAIAAYVG